MTPILAKNCFGCHNDKVRSGTLSLQGLTDPAAALQQASIWEKVLVKTTAGEMPPRPRAPLPESDLAALATWIRNVPGIRETVAASTEPSDPGRVTAGRAAPPPDIPKLLIPHTKQHEIRALGGPERCGILGLPADRQPARRKAGA